MIDWLLYPLRLLCFKTRRLLARSGVWCSHDFVKRSACNWTLYDENFGVLEKGHRADRFDECVDCGVAIKDGVALPYIKGGR